MADYWKSQPRKFCDFCKCWIADNKPSRDFHEKGKKHQQNVKDKINQVMKKGVTDSKKEADMENMLKQMEQKAMSALKKDLQNNPNMASQYGVTVKNKEPESVAIPEFNDDTSSDESSEVDQPAPDSTTKQSTTKDEDPNVLWKEEWTPEGYVYYWHTVTGETTWVPPEGYTPTWERPGAEKPKDQTEQSNDNEVNVQNPVRESERVPSPITDSTAEGVKTTDETPSENSTPAENIPEPETKLPTPPQPSSVPLNEITLPADIPLPPPPSSTVPGDTPQSSDDQEPQPSRLSEQSQAEPSQLNVHSGPARVKSSPYGTWESVPEPVQQPNVDLQLPAKHSSSVEFKAIPVNEPKLKFRQKKVDTLGAEFMAFKKRKLNSGNRSLRTTDTEKD